MSVKRTLRRSLYGDSAGLESYLQNDIIKQSGRQSLYSPSIDNSRDRDESSMNNLSSSTRNQSNKQSKSKRSTSINTPRALYNASQIDLNNYEKNTNNYQHLFGPSISPTSATQHAFSLRSPICFSARANSPTKECSPPKCYEENINKKTVNINFSMPRERYDHLMRHRIGPSIGSIQLDFEVGLRNYGNTSIDIPREKDWDPTQHKDNQKKTVFLPTLKQEIQLKKIIKLPEKRNLHSYRNYIKTFEIDAFDGYHKYPSYNDRIVRNKNNNIIPYLKKSRNEGDKSINQLNWELNLNNYRLPQRKDIEKTND